MAQIEKDKINTPCGGTSHAENIEEAIKIVLSANEKQLKEIIEIITQEN